MNRIAQRGLSVLLLVTLAAASLASTAAAHRGHGRGHGGRAVYGHVRYGGYPVIIERRARPNRLKRW